MSTSDTPKVRVLLVDDHALLRSALRLLIDGAPGLRVVGEAGRADEAVDLARREQPDTILLDVNLRGQNGLEFIPPLLEAAPGARVIVLTGVLDPEAHRQAVSLGASGLVLKEKAPDVLIKAIKKVHQGEVWLDRSLMGSVISSILRKRPDREADPEAANIEALTKRELEVIALIGEGLKNRQMADRLFISEGTVRHHITSIFSKLGLTDRFELIMYAYRHNLATPPLGPRTPPEGGER